MSTSSKKPTKCRAKTPSSCRVHGTYKEPQTDQIEEIFKKLERVQEMEAQVRWTKQMFALLAAKNNSVVTDFIEGLSYSKVDDMSLLETYNKEYAELEQKLTGDEKEALRDYTGITYSLVNDYLRLGENRFIADSKPEFATSRLRRAKETVKHLDSIFSKKTVSTRVGNLYRFLHQDVTEKFVSSESFAKRNQWVEGNVVNFSSYLSTSIDANLLEAQISEDKEENTSIVFVISTDKGIPVDYTPMKPAHQRYSQDFEREVLLPRGMQFIVEKVTRGVGYQPRSSSNNSRPINPLTIFLKEI